MRITRRRGMTLSILELALLIGVTVFLLTGAWAANTQGELADRVVRLHVIANSDAEEDQALKLQVRDAVLARTEAILRASADREEAEVPAGGGPAGAGAAGGGDRRGQRL